MQLKHKEWTKGTYTVGPSLLPVAPSLRELLGRKGVLVPDLIPGKKAYM